MENTYSESYRQKQKLCNDYIKNLSHRATNSEIIFAEKLRKIKIKFKFQKGFIKNGFCIVDFYIPQRKLCIEIDGGYHLTEAQRWKDKQKDQYLRSRGFKVVRLTNHLAETIKLDDLKNIIH